VKKLIGILLSVALLLVLMPAVVGANDAPTIDGVISPTDEWGEPTFVSGDYFNVYVQNDTDYLYVAFETLGGTYLPTGDGTVGMMNLYVMNLVTEECWAYCWIHRTPDFIEISYTYPPDPTVKLPTSAEFAVTDTVFELQVPLSELESISLGDTINLHFLSYAEGWTNWTTCWLHNQEYFLAPPSKAGILKDSGVPGKGLDEASGLQKPFNPNSRAGDNAGKK